MARPWVAAWIALLSLAAVVAAPPVQGVDGPTLTRGDFWTYSTNTTLAPGFYLEGQVTFLIEAREPVSVNGTVLDAYRVSFRGEGEVKGRLPGLGGGIPATGSWSFVGEELFEAGGLKVVRSFLDLQADGRTQPLAQSFTLRVQNTTTFDILDDTWRFPVEVGETATVAVLFNSTEDVSIRYGFFGDSSSTKGEGLRTLVYLVEERVSTSTSAGVFDAYRIRESWPDGQWNLLFFAQEVGNNVRTEAFNKSGIRVAMTSLSSYRYHAAEPLPVLGLPIVYWAMIMPVAAVALTLAVRSLHRRRRRQIGLAQESPPDGPP